MLLCRHLVLDLLPLRLLGTTLPRQKSQPQGQGQYLNGHLSGFAMFFGFAMVGTFVCELISSGSFYLWSGNFEPTMAEFVSRELMYAPAAFSSSAYWAVALIVVSALYRMYAQAKAPEALSH